MCVAIDEWAAKLGKPKRTSSLLLPPEGLDDTIRAMIGQQVRYGTSACFVVPACVCASLCSFA
jgi:hypothetical protein